MTGPLLRPLPPRKTHIPRHYPTDASWTERVRIDYVRAARVLAAAVASGDDRVLPLIEALYRPEQAA